jgi:hypothetical protein
MQIVSLELRKFETALNSELQSCMLLKKTNVTTSITKGQLIVSVMTELIIFPKCKDAPEPYFCVVSSPIEGWYIIKDLHFYDNPFDEGH